MAEERENQLFQAALTGNSLQLEALHHEDPLILDRHHLSSAAETPVHIAALRGHADFVKSALNHNSRLALETDSRGFTPLHVASAAGNVEVVREILRRFSGSDLVSITLARSKDGRIPLHLAVEKGRLEVLSELAGASPESTCERLGRGQTAVHLCVCCDFLEGMKVICEMERRDELTWERDHDGNTPLHLATLYKQLETVKYLVTKPGLDLNALNNNGFTALDLIYSSPRDLTSLQIITFLLESGSKRTTYSTPRPTTTPIQTLTTPTRLHTSSPKTWKRIFRYTPSYTLQLDQLRGALIIAATLLAGHNFQVGVNPPPGDSDLTTMWTSTTISLFSSLVVVVLLIGGVPLKNNVFCVWIIVSMFIVCVFFMAYASVGSITSNESRYTSEISVVLYLFFVFLALVAVVGLIHLIRFGVWVWRKLVQCVQRKKKRSFHHEDASLFA